MHAVTVLIREIRRMNRRMLTPFYFDSVYDPQIIPPATSSSESHADDGIAMLAIATT